MDWAELVPSRSSSDQKADLGLTTQRKRRAETGSGRNRARISVRLSPGTHASLLTATTRTAVRTIKRASQGTEMPRLPKSAPSRQASAPHGVSGKPEATWAQPLSREELSARGVSTFGVSGLFV